MTKARVNADNVTADIAGITAGTGITGGGTSGTVTITNDMATTIAAAGDLIYGTANDAYTRLGLGTAGQLLKVNSGATAPEWGAAPESGGMTLISTTTMSGATVTLSSIPQTYKTLYGIIFGVTNNTGTAFHYIRPNGPSAESQYSVFSGSNSNATKVLQGSEFTWNFEVSGYSLKRTDSGNVSFFEIHNYTSATSFKAINSGGYYVANNDASVAYAGSGSYYNTSAITSIDFVNNGNYTYSAGTILLYGVK